MKYLHHLSQILTHILAFLLIASFLASCRSTAPSIAREDSLQSETAFRRTRSAEISFALIAESLCHLDADSIIIHFPAFPANGSTFIHSPRMSEGSAQAEDVPSGHTQVEPKASPLVQTATVPASSDAGSVSIYGAHFDSEKKAATSGAAIFSDSISSEAALQSGSEEHVTPPPNSPSATSRTSSWITSLKMFMNKLLVRLLLILLLATFAYFMGKGAIKWLKGKLPFS